jgi:hypothetical protein
MTAAEWDEYIGAAPNLAVATDRIEEAARAGVDFAALADAQSGRHLAEGEARP